MEMIMIIATWINVIFILALIGAGTYGFTLFVELANRVSKALDIYIKERTDKKSYILIYLL
ncbi:hypothetical protein GKZ28_27080 [Clostridium chromiireducens]|uniref:Uncharacterized protein n=1 Tax=Clostridium chromiireducens TaxID=225345 RepID=A0A964W5G1_9CLOT|nr:hypothetical protein [Clostridium chromiireducens]MVX67297.1 hypothetical protein [Clostridium chromiireducens]